MGKRSAAKKPPGPRKNAPLATVFPCLFCNHEKSVTVKLEKKAGVGQLNCKVCSQQFQCAVNYLSAAVDVYSDWVDACDAIAKEDTGERVHSRPVGGRASLGGGTTGTSKRRHNNEEGNIDDLIDDADASDGNGGGYGRNGGDVADDDDY